MEKNYGLILDVVQDIKEYVLGASKMPFIEYNESGDWEAYLPKFEKQRTDRDQETSACTVFASLSQIETFYKYLYGIEPNYSERFTYNLVPITPAKGADPHRTHETIRAYGLIDERHLPMTRTIAEYLDKSDITKSLLAKGLNWLRTHDYMHEWVWNLHNRPINHVDVLRDALKTSPIAVSVSAWNRQGDVYVSNQGSVNNHYCLLYKVDADGYPWVFDTYDYSKKKLSKDHDIRRAKRIWLNQKTSARLARKHVSILQVILNKLMNKKTLLDVCNEWLGKDASPKDNAPDGLACAESMSDLIALVYPDFPKIVSTITMNDFLDSTLSGFQLVQNPLPGDIIISPTQGPRVGHVGIIMEDWTIASNDSGLGTPANKGKFLKNYSLVTWTRRYRDKLGLRVNIYRRIKQ